MTTKKYTYFFVFFSCLVTGFLSSLNYLIDPYLLFQSTRIPGINDKKPTAANRSTLYKTYNVSNIRPQTLIVGNSRPEMGLNPESTCWPSNAGVVYNLTFPGLSTYGQARALFHAVANGNVERILLGIDFADFLNKKNISQKKSWPSRNSDFFKRLIVDEQLQKNQNYWLTKVKDYSSTLFSLSTLSDSVITLMSQSANSTDRTKLGFNPAKDYHEIIRFEGAWVLFEQKKNELEQRFSETEMSIYDSGLWSEELEAVKRVIQLSVAKNIQLILFINPYHYSYLDVINNKGYWDEFVTFKKRLAETVELYGKDQITLWDFALYSNYTVSLVPKKNDPSPVFNWFWEPAHYKSALGDLMLNDIFGLNCVKSDLGPVGVTLNKLNIDTHMLNQQQQRSILLEKMLSQSHAVFN